MILAHGTEEILVNKEKQVRYKFFDDPVGQGQDAIFGLDRTVMSLVNVLKSAANRYGTERRVSAAPRAGGQLQEHDRPTAQERAGALLEEPTTEALYTFGWREEGLDGDGHLRRLPDARGAAPPRPPGDSAGVMVDSLSAEVVRRRLPDRHRRRPLPVLPPDVQRADGRSYGGDWSKVLDDVRVRRLILSEQDRVGIGTFQPKDEKNQDATELTGDINYRKIAEYGTESDPRAFNFDGEFNIANRGIIEFIEVLEARRRLPLRSARRQPGAQDQAQEVRPDRHRRSDHRPHQRAGI